MNYKIINQSNYSGKTVDKKSGSTITFYTKKQMKVIYPNQNYMVVGEIGEKNFEKGDGVYNTDGKLLPVQPLKAHDAVTEAVAGYAMVDENKFVAVVKNVIIQRAAALLAALVILCGGITFSVNYDKWFSGSTASGVSIAEGANTPDIDDSAKDLISRPAEQPSSSAATAGIAIPGYKSITLKAKQLEQNVYFINPEQNDCYFVITLMLPDGTELYKSKMLPPAKGIYSIKLNQTLEAGTYDNSVIKYECFKMDDNLTPLNGAEVKLSLIVQ
jgi:hypothetical protein